MEFQVTLRFKCAIPDSQRHRILLSDVENIFDFLARKEFNSKLSSIASVLKNKSVRLSLIQNQNRIISIYTPTSWRGRVIINFGQYFLFFETFWDFLNILFNPSAKNNMGMSFMLTQVNFYLYCCESDMPLKKWSLCLICLKLRLKSLFYEQVYASWTLEREHDKSSYLRWVYKYKYIVTYSHFTVHTVMFSVYILHSVIYPSYTTCKHYY